MADQARSARGTFVPSFTAEEVERVADCLRSDRFKTHLQACIDAGVPEKYGALKMCLSRLRRGELTDSTAALIAPIAAAIDEQCRIYLREAVDISAAGGRTNHQEWFLERKNPAEYGRVTKTELTGEDGGPVRVDSKVKSMTDEELIETMLATQTQVDGGSE